MAKKDQNKDFGDLKKLREEQRRARENPTGDLYRSPNLFDSPMMARIIEAIDKGEDVGHYGRLVFVMVARFFLTDEEMLTLLRKRPDFDAREARIMIT